MADNLHLMTCRADFLNYAREVLAAFGTTTTRTSNGAVVPHSSALEVWVDVAYFTAPAMAEVGRLLKDDGLLERALDQVLLHHRYLVDVGTELCWHVAYADKGTHSQCLSARGNSWFAIAAAQVIGVLGSRPGEGHFKPKVASLEAAVARQLNAVVRVQDESGLWHSVIDRKDSYLESSAAAGFALALGRALAHRIPGMDRESAAAAYERAIAVICSKVDERGDFVGVSQQTPPGDFVFYNSVNLGTAPFGAGLC